MKYGAFDRKIEEMQQRVDFLQQRVHKSGAQKNTFAAEMLEKLGTTLEELRVSQEELRQQNEELLELSQRWAAERERYRELFEFAPDGYMEPSCWMKSGKPRWPFSQNCCGSSRKTKFALWAARKA